MSYMFPDAKDPKNVFMFILESIAAFILLPFSLSYYIILLVCDRKRKLFNKWNDFNSGAFAGTFTTIGCLTLGSTVCYLFDLLIFKIGAPENEGVKMILIYFTGLISAIILIEIFKAIVKFLKKSKINSKITYKD